MLKRILHAVVLLPLVGCSPQPEQRTTMGEAFVGPVRLELYQDLGPRQPAVATVKHGERLAILGRRRVFVKVRTSEGIEGWTDGRLLFNQEQMDDLRWLAEQATRLPSQGEATVYGALNVHTEPNRQAPSFVQLKEGDRVELVAHRLAPRMPYRPHAPAPKLPTTAPMDDWSLVRTADGKAGWVLFRMLVMAIPDEVAQYAEGHRITSYFSLGGVKDGDEVKHNWVWTTIRKGWEPYEFDSFRVFVWSRRRHRYETAYIERNLKGFYPVEVQLVEATPGENATASPTFSLIIEDKDGLPYRRTYAFQGYRVRLLAKEQWNPPDLEQLLRRPREKKPAIEVEEKSFLTRLKERLEEFGR
jgi:SH3-like domain-containing protein